MQIGKHIAFHLQYTCSEWESRRRCGIRANRMVNEIRSKRCTGNILGLQVAGKLMKDGRYHFDVGKLFRTDVRQNTDYFSVRHGEALAEISRRCSEFAIRTARRLLLMVNYTVSKFFSLLNRKGCREIFEKLSKNFSKTLDILL